MTENIPGLIAELRDTMPEEVLRAWARDAKAALESLSAPAALDLEPQPGDGPDYHAEHAYWAERQPVATDTDREALIEAIANKRRWPDLGGIADAILAVGFRRLSPVTREALEDAIGVAPTAGTLSAKDVAIVAAEILSRFDFQKPEPAEVEWATELRVDGSVEHRFPADSEADARATATERGEVVVCRKVGPWVPVKGAEQ